MYEIFVHARALAGEVSVCSVCAFSEVGHAVNVQRLRHADTDTEACRQLSAMATGVAAEMVQLLHGYFRLISVHHQAPFHSLPTPPHSSSLFPEPTHPCLILETGMQTLRGVHLEHYYIFSWLFD